MKPLILIRWIGAIVFLVLAIGWIASPQRERIPSSPYPQQYFRDGTTPIPQQYGRDGTPTAPHFSQEEIDGLHKQPSGCPLGGLGQPCVGWAPQHN